LILVIVISTAAHVVDVMILPSIVLVHQLLWIRHIPLSTTLRVDVLVYITRMTSVMRP